MGENEELMDEMPDLSTGDVEDVTPEVEPDESAAMRKALDDANRRAEFYEQMYMRQQATVPEPQEDETQYSQDGFPSYGEVDGIVEKVLQKRLKPVEQKLRDQEIRQGEEVMRMKYPDYDEVLNTFTRQIFKEDPSLANLVYQSSQAPLYAYRLGITHPEYQKRVKSKTTQDIAGTIQRNQSLPKPVGKVGGSGGASSTSVWDLPKDKFNEMVKRAKAGQQMKL